MQPITGQRRRKSQIDDKMARMIKAAPARRNQTFIKVMVKSTTCSDFSGNRTKLPLMLIYRHTTSKVRFTHPDKFLYGESV